jgi:leucyl-tRNA synthetase
MVKKKIDFSKLEKKWQGEWEKKKIFEVKEGKGKKDKKYYVLEQFPYPSGTGLHMGHAFIYTIGDIFSRFKIMNGFNVLHPMGYDSLGLPAENAAIKVGTHPKKYTDESIKNFVKQQKALGLTYDWGRMFWTHDPEYYKWDQWIFLKMLEKGIAFRKKAPVNWCSKCNTVLANEQVHNGMCWRHENTEVEVKHLEQWFLKITNYSKELANFDSIKEWPDLIKKLQKNWIGKSHGTEINFEINGKPWKIFTTRPDTIFGVTFMVVSAQHPDLMSLVDEKHKEDVEKFLKKIKSVSEKDMEDLEKEGVFSGSYAVNPLTGEEVPVWIGNFVVADYGSGMVMAVPAHDQRDWEFAKKYKIKIKEVIKGGNVGKAAYTGEGSLVNSGKFDGMNSKKAISSITEHLKKKKLGKKVIQYKLRDWLVSRQRYWGTPIPIIYCDKCGIVSVPEKDLPIALPEKVKFGKGNPLETSRDFVNVKCPKCKGKAKRETDTMDTFVNSSWYFLRFCDPSNKKQIFDPKKANYWVPIDMYIGGAEHACMHDIYFRFYHKFLRDIGLVKSNEPAKKLFVQGMIHGEDGNKMSKSLGNVVDPLDVIKKYNADALRMFLVSVASPDSNFNWSDKGIQGSAKFVNRVCDYFSKLKLSPKSSKIVESKINKAIKEITLDIENFKFNLAVIKVRALLSVIDEEQVSKKDIESFLKLLSVFCPHIAEEFWNKLGNKTLISKESWPVASEAKIDSQLEKQEKQIGSLVSDINNILKILESKKEKVEDKGIKVFVIPSELKFYKDAHSKIQADFAQQIEILSIKDAKELGKDVKAKPGKPGIFIE